MIRLLRKDETLLFNPRGTQFPSRDPFFLFPVHFYFFLIRWSSPRFFKRFLIGSSFQALRAPTPRYPRWPLPPSAHLVAPVRGPTPRCPRWPLPPSAHPFRVASANFQIPAVAPSPIRSPSRPCPRPNSQIPAVAPSPIRFSRNSAIIYCSLRYRTASVNVLWRSQPACFVCLNRGLFC